MPSAKPRSSKKVSPVAPEDRTPSEVVAAAIVARYSDLAPSVTRIMQAGLEEPARLHAITAFQESLGVPGDPMRNPANAIAAARVVSAEPG